MSTIFLEIITPDKGKIYSGEISMLIVRTICGELGILPKHAPLLTELIPNVARIKISGVEERLFVGNGFIEVTPEKITVLADSAERLEDIDPKRAKAAYERAKNRISAYNNSPKTHTEIDIKRAEAALARAKARLLIKQVPIN